MRNSITLLALTVSLFLMPGCSQVKFYSDPGLTNETGLCFFTLKPYLLVEYKATKDNTVKTSVVYLPDIANPQYMALKPGIGSNEIKLGLENGALVSYGLTSEPEFQENIEALATLLAKSAGAVDAFTGREMPSTDETEISFRLYEIISGDGNTVLREIVPISQENK
jgi:hypothetical protein